MTIRATVLDRVRPAYAGMGVCVTGGAGFIGGHLVAALVEAGAEVTIIDDLSSGDAGTLAGLLAAAPERLRFIHASVLEGPALERAVRGAGVVFHVAGMTSVPRSMHEPQRSWVVNAAGTQRVLEAARVAGVCRVVYSASSSAYGDNPELPRHEGLVPMPVSPYAAAKLAGEHAALAWSRLGPMDTVSLRYFNIFGPRQPLAGAYAGVIPAFVSRLLAGERPVIFGDGLQTRDLTHVSGAVEANLLAGVAPRVFAGAVINIGAGRRLSIGELAAKLAAIVGRPELTAEHAAARAGDVRDSHADIGRARELLGYEPPDDLDRHLADTVAWYRKRVGARAVGVVGGGDA